MTMKSIDVVAAVIVKKDLVFVSQRGYGEFKDGWEFPGGKIKPGEPPEQALVREIKEELDASIAVDAYLDTVSYDYPQFHMTMRIYRCHLEKPHLELLEHEAAKWVTKDQLDQVPFLPADKLALGRIKASLA